MILSFGSKETEKIFKESTSSVFPHYLVRIIKRKLLIIHASISINDLRVPPANHLKKLKGRKKDFYSIRINDQWRICFVWKNMNAYDVEIIDYH